MYKYLIFPFLLFSVACSQGGKSASFSNTKEDFGPKKQDSLVGFKNEKSKKINWQFEGWISTHELMQSLVSLFEHAPNSEVPYLLLDKYYSNKHTTTSVNIDSGTYVEAALGIYGPDIFNSINVANVNNYDFIKTAFSTWDTRIEANLDPAQVVQRIMAHLQGLPDQMTRSGVNKAVVTGASGALQKYLNDLEKTRRILSLLKQDRVDGGLKYNLEIIQRALQELVDAGIIKQADISDALKELEFPASVVNMLNPKSYDSVRVTLFHIFKHKRKIFLANIGKTNPERFTSEEIKEFSLSFPPALQSFATTFANDSDGEINWYIRGKTDWVSWAQNTYLNGLMTELQKTPIDQLVLDIEYGVNSTVIAALANTLAAKAELLPAIISPIVLEKYSSSEQNFYYDFYNQIKKVASDSISRDLLGGEKSFPGIEGKYVYWPVEKTKSTFESYFLTGGKEIGSAIQANIFFFENLNHAPIRIVDQKYRKYTFALLNRLLAIFGYRDFNGVLSKSLHQRFTPTEAIDMDIYTYDQEKGVFALPDNLILTSGYKVYSPADQQLVQTVGGRASLIKASAKLLDFFADYNVNAFDKEFSSFQFEGFSVFPKEPIFDLGLGSMSILLRNLTKGEAIFFDTSGKRLPSTGDVLKDAKGAASVALLSRKAGNMYDNVQAEDTADYIIALGSLLESARNLPKAKVGLLSRLIDGERKDLNAIMDVVPSLRKLQYGLGLFLHNKMVRDGWLANTYFLQTQTTSDNDYNLIRQLKLIQALLSVYKEWQADLFLWAAVDAYYTMNEKLDVEGGYELQSSFPLYEVTETWKTLVTLQKSLESTEASKKVWWKKESDEQLKKLINYYKSNWQDLANVN
jgi:hypothetical protein